MSLQLYYLLVSPCISEMTGFLGQTVEFKYYIIY